MPKPFAENVAETSYILDDPTPLPRPDPKLAENVLDLFSLRGKVACVTGGGQGIGYSVIEAYAQAGADVAVWDLYDAKEVAAKLAEKYGVKAISYACDVTDASAVEATVAKIVEDFGAIDVFVANAGININIGSIVDDEFQDKNWQKVLDININGVFYCAKHVGRVFKKQKSGSFIITGSMSGFIINTPVHQAAYNTSKAAVVHLAKSLAIEFVGFNARVNSISPGYVNSGINDHLPHHVRQRWWSVVPMGREGLPKELVGAYLYLASDASTYTTGADIKIDGGFTVC